MRNVPILAPSPATLSPLPARSLVIAPRLPALPKKHTGNPFTTLGDVVADCTVEGCGYHAMGPRDQVGHKLRQHHRENHADQVSIVLLNDPRR